MQWIVSLGRKILGCASSRPHQGEVNIEVVFRIVYNQLEVVTPDYCREFDVEVTLKSAQNAPVNSFSRPALTGNNGGNGGLKRRVQSDQVVHALPAPRARQAGVSPNMVKKNPPKTPKEPRIKELLLQALKWKHLLDTGQVASQADIARLEGITRGRVTQIMSLLQLSPTIQRRILEMPKSARRPHITERAIRHITMMENPKKQLDAFQEIAEG